MNDLRILRAGLSLYAEMKSNDVLFCCIKGGGIIEQHRLPITIATTPHMQQNHEKRFDIKSMDWSNY